MCETPGPDCVFTCGDYKYDLNSLRHWTNGEMVGSDDAGAFYRWGVCGAKLPPEATCDPLSNSSSVLAIMVDLNGGQCTTIGRQEKSEASTFCQITDASRPENGITCAYFDGDAGSSMSVEYSCAATSQRPALTLLEPTPPKVQVVLSDPNACGQSTELPWVWIIASCAVGGALLLVLGALLACCICRRFRRARDLSGYAPPHSGPLLGGADRQSFDMEAEKQKAQSRSWFGFRRAPPPKEPLISSSPYKTGPTSPSARSSDRLRQEEMLAGRAPITGLAPLLERSGLSDKLAAATTCCEQQGWPSVAHIKSSGEAGQKLFIISLRIKPDGPRARRLKRELARDEWAWDAHNNAAADRVEAQRFGGPDGAGSPRKGAEAAEGTGETS